jgi:hypothetical protein
MCDSGIRSGDDDQEGNSVGLSRLSLTHAKASLSVGNPDGLALCLPAITNSFDSPDHCSDTPSPFDCTTQPTPGSLENSLKAKASTDLSEAGFREMGHLLATKDYRLTRLDFH